MDRKEIIAANWKMNLKKKEIIEFIESFLDRFPDPDSLKNGTYPKTIILFPSSPYIDLTIKLLEGYSILVGAQNLYYEKEGSFTGEISASMVADLGARYVLVGHSERRIHFNEDMEVIHKKLLASVEAGLNPILSIGETLEEREQLVEQMVIVDQLETAFAGMKPEDMKRMTISYEPVWAIGTGKRDTPEDVCKVVQLIRRVLRRNWGENIGMSIPILYGGSVSPDTYKAYLSRPEIGGVLIGQASQEAKSFLRFFR